MLFLGFNLAETILAWPPQGGGQAQQKPNLAKAHMVEAEHEENLVQWTRQAQHAGNQDSKNKLGRKLTQLISDSRRPPVKAGGPHSYGWKDIRLTKP